MVKYRLGLGQSGAKDRLGPANVAKCWLDFNRASQSEKTTGYSLANQRNVQARTQLIRAKYRLGLSQ